MSREKFTPKEGQVYQNINGGVFRCVSSDPEHLSGDATMQSVVSGCSEVRIIMKEEAV